MLTAKQMRTSLAGTNLIGKITVAKMEDMISKLDVRLAENLISVYSAGFIPSTSGSSNADSRGMRVLEDLRQLKKDFQLAQPIVFLMKRSPQRRQRSLTMPSTSVWPRGLACPSR